MDAEAISSELKKKDLVDTFNTLYSMHRLLNRCIYISFEFLNNLNLKECLTEIGLLRFEKLQISCPDIKPSFFYFALLKEFYHEDLYIDVSKINTDETIKLLSEAIRNGEIRFIWAYGRHLYDKYFEECETQSENLAYDEVVKLLDGTYQGVYQIGHVICGPYGFLKTKVQRFINPKLDIHLWHCSDPSCSNFHESYFNNSSSDQLHKVDGVLQTLQEEKAYIDIDELAKITFDKKNDEYYDPFTLKDLDQFLGNCFGTAELAQLLIKLIENQNLRERLLEDKKKGSAQDIVNGLKRDECFQLIMLATNEEIVLELEKLINSELIKIPATEIRSSHLRRYSGRHGHFLQCNQLGIRVSSSNSRLAVLNLKKLLKDVHNDSPLREQLDWKLKRFGHEFSLDQKLEKYIISEDPKKIIEETILIGPSQLSKVFQLLPGEFKMPITVEEEQRLINKIVWKLGFDIRLFPNQIERFWEHLSKLKYTVDISGAINENDKENIRSSAVNFFVSLEEILEKSLSFLTWALLSDHYLDTKFRYVFEDSRDVMVSVLNGHEYTTGEKLILDRDGKNTLFPLIQGFESLVQVCDELLSKEPLRRPKSEFPSFYLNDPLNIFPFEHKKFIFDMVPKDYENLKAVLKSINSNLSKGNVINVRNRLQHKRDDFPSKPEILEAIKSVESVVSKLESYHIYPNVYHLQQSIKDEFNRLALTICNYKGNKMTVHPSMELIGSHIPDFVNPSIVFEPVKLGLTDQPLRFQYMEKSDYQAYWKDYPLRKTKSSK